MNFNEWFKTRRKELGLTQCQLAERLNVHQVNISQFENNKRPNTDIMKQVECVLGRYEYNYVPAEIPKIKKEMSQKTIEGLSDFRDKKEDSFYIELEDKLYITADRYQYVLCNGIYRYYFIEFKSLIKFLIDLKVREDTLKSVQEVCDKLDEIYSKIEKRFDNFDPAEIHNKPISFDDNEEE